MLYSPIVIKKTVSDGGGSEQLGIYPVDSTGKPTGDAIVPSNITTITNGIFSNCKANTITFKGAPTDIDPYAFRNSANLTSVSGMHSISNYAINCFENVTNLTTLNLTESNISSSIIIGTAAFSCTNINTEQTNLLLSHCRSVGSSAFAKCNNITDLNINLDNVGVSAFSECANLVSANVDSTSVANSIFINCSSLSNVNLSEKVTAINYYAFQNCSNLSTITIPNSVTTIQGSVFRYCKSLTSVVIPDSVTEIGSVCFSQCTNLSSITLSNNISILPSGIFEFCSSLTNVVLPNKLTTIQSSAFFNCNQLTDIIFPESTTTVQASIFNKCTSLSNISLSKITTQSSNCLTATNSAYIFNNCTALSNVSVPLGWNQSLRLNVSDSLTHDSIVTLFSNLADLTGTTSKIITIGANNLSKITDEELLIATTKNWTVS